MSEKEKDYWDKTQIVGQVFLPIAIAAVGLLITFCQNNAAEDRQKTVRVTGFLEHLSSPNKKLSSLALISLEHMSDKGLADKDYVNVISAAITAINDDEIKDQSIGAIKQTTDTLAKFAENENKETAGAAKDKLKELTKSDDSKVALSAKTSLETVDSAEVQNLSARVYLHIEKGQSPETIEKIKKALEDKGLKVPKINEVEKAPANTDFRFFKESNREDIDLIKGILSNLKIENKEIDLTDRYPKAKIRPRHYEIWLKNEKKTEKNIRPKATKPKI